MSVKASEIVELAQPDFGQLRIKIVGTTSLIIHAWSQKAIQEMLDAQMGNKKKRDLKNPWADAIDSLYWLEGKPTEQTEEAFNRAIQKGAKFGFPSSGIKQAMISASYRAKAIKDQVTMRGAIYIPGEYIPIIGTPHSRMDMVKLSGIGAPPDIRFRGEFNEWSSEFELQYDKQFCNADFISNALNLAGFTVGIGEWRPEKKGGGNHGMFTVTNVDIMKMSKK
jgi:hypothetical protein